jgi:hypothetical protein
MKRKRLNLSLPENIFNQLKEIARARGATMTSFLQSTLFTRLDSELSGQRKCTTGERCVLGIFPELSQRRTSPLPISSLSPTPPGDPSQARKGGCG